MTRRAPDRLIVFARQPVAGRVKTRLGAALPPREAARLYRAFVLDALEGALRVPGAAVTLAYTPRGARQAMQALAARAAGKRGRPIRLSLQRGADLGGRIASALRDAFACGASRAVVIGTDSPTLPAGRLEAAFTALEAADLVLGPTEDGGYYLLGARAPLPPGLLDGIAWSTGGELVETLGRADGAELRAACLHPWHDVDEPADLDRLRHEMAASATRREGAAEQRSNGRQEAARHTRAALTALFRLEPAPGAGV